MSDTFNAVLPAEWAPQSGIQLTWPHAGTDWAHMLTEVQACFAAIAREIAQRELLLIVTPEPEEVKKQISATVNMQNVRFMECETNDTWARDHGAITMLDSEGASLLDFMFNGWGLKFASDKDNLITRQAVEAGFLNGRYVNRLGFVLEGGSIESDGLGTLLTTSECLLSPNRNGQMSRDEIEDYLCSVFHLNRYFGSIMGIWQVMIRIVMLIRSLVFAHRILLPMCNAPIRRMNITKLSIKWKNN